MYHNLQALKLKPETAKTGSRWTPEEVKQLLEEVKNSNTLKSIALAHQRTEGSINSKLLGTAASLISEGQNIKEVSKIVNKTEDEIKDYIKMQGDKPIRIKKII